MSQGYRLEQFVDDMRKTTSETSDDAKIVTPIALGQASAMITVEIHSVMNETDETTISLHNVWETCGFCRSLSVQS